MKKIDGVLTSVLDPSVPGLIEPHDPYADDIISHTAPQYNIIDDVDDQTIANVFCFGAFTDKISGVIYNDCTGKFPYMSLDGNVSFFCNVPLQNKHHPCNTNPRT